jgi:precorrin-6Y C5,15-methyltransferase (decarboxylating)
MPWSDARLISLHGRRDEAALLAALAEHHKIGLLTDTVHTPAWLAGFMIARGYKDFEMCVLEKLGSDDETAAWYPLNEVAGKTFRSPNVVILHRTPPERPETVPPLYPGMPEEAFVHESGLITKAEVRAVTLSKLRLSSPHLVLWDLGAGSGSVSVEAGLFIRTGRIVAVEQHPRRIAHIQANRERFGIDRMEIVRLVLPEGLEDLPAPDRVFIGGGGKNLGRIIEAAAARLRPGGVMVANTVLLQNIDAALTAFGGLGFETDIIQVQVSGGKKMPWGDRLAPQNPVWIITGIAPDGRSEETPIPDTLST